ncbi:MAG TPA: hypothetical protein VFY82_10890 [Acidimicrobiales bacterium]|nr:hypothetical protein [Acidimicrobiales bacterium]
MAIFGIGYLVGTRAGRDRYQQIAESVREVAESDVVRGYVDRAFDMARRPLESADASDDASEEAVTDEASEGDEDEDEGEADGDGDGARRKTTSRTRAGRSK